jgi:D-amino-acid dehydrogenase
LARAVTRRYHARATGAREAVGVKIIVLGAGIVGVSSAYFLAKNGHEVVVIEREGEVGQDASAGNAGLIAPGHSYAWASPAAPKLMLQSLAGKKTSIRVKPRLDPALVTWGVKFLRECTTDRAKRNTLVKHNLCRYSHRLITSLAADEKIDYAAETAGMFYLYGDEAELEAGFAKTSLLRDNGEDLQLLDVDAVVAKEPVLAHARDQIAGAIYGADDASGDCERFTKGLADACRKLGVEFQLGRTINGLRTEAGGVTAVQTTNGDITGDGYVLALGVGSAQVGGTIGLKVPVYPAKGYSVTFPVREDSACPRVGGVDENTLVAWSRMGDALRMSSTAEFAGYDRSWRLSDFDGVLETARRLFPDAAHYDQGRYRACLRPMTPDGPPLIGATKFRNLWLNTGHGHMGWTMGPGAGKLVADVISGRQTDLDLTGMQAR